jgi:hypothetical protein
MTELREYDEYDFGLTWVIEEQMGRASHALRDDSGGVWFVDPVDVPEAIDRALELGPPAGVIQLLDRHNRDNAALAERFGVPFHRLPDDVPGSPFEVFNVLDVPRWREKALWWPGRRALVVAEAVGTVPYFRVAAQHAGIHPFLRGLPPRSPRRYDPEHLLCGHGSGVHGADAGVALEEAYHRSRRDLPRLPLAILRGR